jgi:hypothetical protein
MANYAYTFTSGDTVTPTKLNNARTVSNIANADISATAAIAGTKVAPNFGSQNVTTTGAVRLGGATVGDLGANSTNASAPRLNLLNNGDNANSPLLVLGKSRDNNLVNDTDTLGTIAFQSHDGTVARNGALVVASGDGTATSTSLPAKLVFSTTGTGNVSSSERMRITNAGNVGIANTSPSEKLHVTGNIKASGFIDSDTSFRGQASDSAAAPSYTWTGDTNTGMFRPAEDTLAFAEGGSEVMRINSSGNVGIGTAAPSTKLDVSGTVTATAFSGPLTGNASTATTLATGRTISLTGDVTATTGSFNGSANATAAATIANNAVSNAKLRDSDALSVIGRGANSSGDPSDITASTDGHVLRRSGTALAFGTLVNASIASNAAIAGTKISPDFGNQEISTSGPVSLGSSGFTTVASGSADGVYISTTPTFSLSRNDGASFFLRRRSVNGAVAVFYRDTSAVGSIDVTTTATAFTTSSDYRLKQNVQPLVGGLAKLAALAPKTFEFKAEPNVKVDGFIAHEVQAVVPQAVTGEKDGEEMQGLDHSKLVPILVAAVQELAAKVAALEAK